MVKIGWAVFLEQSQQLPTPHYSDDIAAGLTLLVIRPS